MGDEWSHSHKPSVAYHHALTLDLWAEVDKDVRRQIRVT